MSKGPFKLKKTKNFDFGNKGNFNLQKVGGNWGSSKEISKKLASTETEEDREKETKRINQ